MTANKHGPYIGFKVYCSSFRCSQKAHNKTHKQGRFLGIRNGTKPARKCPICGYDAVTNVAIKTLPKDWMRK